MRTPLFLLFLLTAGLVVLVLWMAGGVQTPRSFDGPIREVDARAAVDTSTATLDVMVWNIAWGYGWGSEGSGSAKPFSHFERSIREMGAFVRDVGPDLLLLQEVDFDARRSHGVNQAERIAEIAGLPYVAPAVSWKANWVPFPYWPPSNQFGRMESGGAVLSRVPIDESRVTLLPKPDQNPFWYNLFYPFRYHQRVELEFRGDTITIYNAHLEAFDRTNRQLQARRWAEVIERDDPMVRPTVLGGDLNTIPPESDQKDGFVDEPETSFDTDDTLPRLRRIEGLRDAFAPKGGATSDEGPQFTFPAHAPNRKLDHVLVSPHFEIVEAKVLQEAGDVSDHLPLWVRLRPRSPGMIP